MFNNMATNGFIVGMHDIFWTNNQQPEIWKCILSAIYRCDDAILTLLTLLWTSIENTKLCHYRDSIGVYESLHRLINDIIILTRSGWAAPSHILWYYHISQWRWPWWTSLCSTTSVIFVWTEKPTKQMKKQQTLFVKVTISIIIGGLKHSFKFTQVLCLITILKYYYLSFLFFLLLYPFTPWHLGGKYCFFTLLVFSILEYI